MHYGTLSSTKSLIKTPSHDICKESSLDGLDHF